MAGRRTVNPRMGVRIPSPPLLSTRGMPMARDRTGASSESGLQRKEHGSPRDAPFARWLGPTSGILRRWRRNARQAGSAARLGSPESVPVRRLAFRAYLGLLPLPPGHPFMAAPFASVAAELDL